MNKLPALLYSAEFTRRTTGEISFQGDNLVHHVGGREFIDPVFTVSKLEYPYPLPPRVTYPEQPLRVTTSYEALQAFGLAEQFNLSRPRPATVEELLAVHSPDYVEKARQLGLTGGELAEATYIESGAFEIARLSAGAAISAVELLGQGDTNSAFVLARPPGHHAKRDSGGGFCIFNNAALAVVAARRFGWQKALVIDWDLHHGDGTQEIFDDDDRVVYCSLHQFGPELYPEKGNFHETGKGQGAGFSVNLPLPAKTGDAAYLVLFERVVPALAEQFRPDLIVVSAGYDAHFNDTLNPYVWDPGGGLSLSAQLYHRLTSIVKNCATKYCAGRYVVILEGGYNLYNLPAGVVNTAAAMLDQAPPVVEVFPSNIPHVNPDVETYLAQLRQHHRRFQF